MRPGSLNPRTLALALCAWILLVLPACVNGHDSYRPVQLVRGEAVVYIYRPRSLLSPGPVEVYVDQSDTGRLGRNTFLAVIVEPGEHLVRVQRRSDATRLVRIGEGQTVFLEAGASLLGGYVSLVDPGEALARERVARTRAARDPVRATGRSERDRD